MIYIICVGNAGSVEPVANILTSDSTWEYSRIQDLETLIKVSRVQDLETVIQALDYGGLIYMSFSFSFLSKVMSFMNNKLH